MLQHYGSKSTLFTAAIQLLPDSPEEAAQHLAEVLKVRAGDLAPEMRALVRSMLTAPEAADALRHHLDLRAISIVPDDAFVRVASQVLGA